MKRIFIKGIKYSEQELYNEKTLTSKGVISIYKKYYDNYSIQIESVIHYLNDMIHNENGPAVTEYHYNGEISLKEYWRYDHVHNDFGPAMIFYDKCGKIISERYYINNNYIAVNSQKEFENYIKTLILK